MLQVTKGATNTLILTLAEKTTLTNPYYLFYVVGSDQQVVTWIARPTATDSRKDTFTFIEGTTATLTEQIYQYYVYEQTSNSNTNPALATSLVEKGQMKVNDVSQQAYQMPTNTTQYHY